MRSIQQNLPQIEAIGIRPVAISVDPPDISREHFRKANITFSILSDPNTEAIRAYDLLHKGAGENGHDIARPAEFLIDSSGAVRWVNLTENYWVRARPEEIIEAGKLLP